MLNGEAAELAPATTVAQLLLERAGATRGSAVVLDGEVVPRSAWQAQVLKDGAVVEIVTAVQGG